MKENETEKDSIREFIIFVIGVAIGAGLTIVPAVLFTMGYCGCI